ncbi:hypothetical protein [Methylomicrobium sp. Wu6]|uniref:hypothetical protein n=1 Tax=Methylomicrobium sp. Wu6 TaxID=3107928 RepID=UPI002DD64573|nr:hypothetical protein [Methylomicrobium sp. Wu6]MEC4748391.1 hypothetical protein [Methylomicrobium sp. Wu6]
MKNVKTWRWLFVHAAIAYSSIGIAHDQGGTLNAGASATDVYQVSCFDDGGGKPYQLFFEIKSVIPASPPVSAQVINDDLAMSTTDRVGGDENYSPELQVVKPGNNDTYTIVIDKSAAGKASYSLEYHCQDSHGNHTGTDILPLQNQ